MKKVLTVLAIISILWGISALFLHGKSPDGADKIEKKTVTETLLTGKWLSKTDGYKVNNETDATVERTKTLSFKSDFTFVLDSAKQKYSGIWAVDQDLVSLSFNEKKITHLFKNTDPNNLANEYMTSEEMVKLPTKTGKITDGKLSFNEGSEFSNLPEGIFGILNFYEFSGFANLTWKHIVMLITGLIFIFLAIKFDYEPLLLIPIGIGVLIGNIPMFQVADFNLKLGIYEPGSVMGYLYSGVSQGWYPPLIFLGIGAMTDFSSLISNPRLMLLGAAAQVGIFVTFLGALYLGFAPQEAGAIGIIGGADGPTAIFLSSKLANGMNVLQNGETVKNLIGPIAIAAYSYMALVPVIQPPIIKLLTTKKERVIKMKPPRAVSRTEKILFPLVGLLLTAFISPASLPLLGMLF